MIPCFPFPARIINWYRTLSFIIDHVTSLLNLELQCAGLAREKMPEEYEKEAAKCNNLTQLRMVAEKNKQYIEAVHDCLSPVKILLYIVFFLVYS